jgi:hypothetical protein
MQEEIAMLSTRAFLIAAGLLVPLAALGQNGTDDSQPPARVGNVWNNQAHQPTRKEVREQEEAAGLRGTEKQERARTDELEQLDREVLERARQGTNDGVMNGTAATTPP